MCSHVEKHWFLCSPRTSLSIANIPHGTLGPEILFYPRIIWATLPMPAYRPLTPCSSTAGWHKHHDSDQLILANPSPASGSLSLNQLLGRKNPECSSLPFPSSTLPLLSLALPSLTCLSTSTLIDLLLYKARHM